MAERARVNQKLYFARLLLDRAAQADDAAARQALLQGALFHLAVAYRAYLAEIAAAYRHPLDADSAATALPVWQREGRACAELSELAALEQCGEWPARLLNAWREAAGAYAPQAGTSSGDPSSIALADITHSPDIDSCRRWLAAFQALADAQRERLQES